MEQRGGLSERRGTYSFVYSPDARVVSGWGRGVHPCNCAAASVGMQRGVDQMRARSGKCLWYRLRCKNHDRESVSSPAYSGSAVGSDRHGKGSHCSSCRPPPILASKRGTSRLDDGDIARCSI